MLNKLLEITQLRVARLNGEPQQPFSANPVFSVTWPLYICSHKSRLSSLGKTPSHLTLPKIKIEIKHQAPETYSCSSRR